MPRPVVRVALIWFFYLAGLGAFFPYGSWYLSRTLGLDGVTVGFVMSMPSLVGLVAQPAWGLVSDRTGRRTRVLGIVGAGGAAGYLLLALATRTEVLLVAMALFAVFTSAIVPSLWAVTMALLGEGDLKYVGLARVAGTLGFGVTALSFPTVLGALDVYRDHAGPWRLFFDAEYADGAGLRILFPVAAACLAVGSCIVLTLPSTGSVSERTGAGRARAVLSEPRFLRMLVVTFLAFLFMQGPMVLFPLLVHSQGGGLSAIAKMWFLMLSLEVPLVAAFGWSVNRLGIRTVVALGLAAGAARWLVSGFATDLRVIVAAQLLHGATVWGVILGMPALVDSVVPPSLRSTAQGVLAMVGAGMGSLASGVLAGLLIDTWGAAAPARFAGIGVALLALMLPWLLGKGREPSREH